MTPLRSGLEGRLPFFALVILLLLPAAPSQAADAFSDHWHDGLAEIDGYRLRVERYGQVRVGQAVMIYVTEPLRKSTRVKADHPDVNPQDVVDVLKLNFVRDFQTGIYDYNTMTSVFSRTSDFEAMKVSFSSAEWCGHVYSESIFQPTQVEITIRSYFENENASLEVDRPRHGIAEEELFIRLRGLRQDFLPPGGSVRLPLLPSSFVQRLLHQAPEWTTVEIDRLPTEERIEVPAGAFDAMIYKVRIADGREGTFAIETEMPHRILQWKLEPDVEGVLTGTLRTPYWNQHDEGDEALLEKLGLSPVVSHSETGP